MPAIILPFLRNVYFIPTTRSVFMLPDHPRFRMNGHTLRVAVTIRINRGHGSFLIDKRIVFRDRSVVIDPMYFSLIPVQGLRIFIPFTAIPDGNIQLAVRPKNHPATVVMPGGKIGGSLKYYPGIRQLVILKLRPGDSSRSHDFISLLYEYSIRNIFLLIVFKIGVQQNIKQSSLPLI